MNLLLVDDDKNIFNLLKAYMLNEDRLIYLSNLENVILTLESDLIDLVILDIQIGESNGLEFFSNNKDFFHARKIPVFLLSQVQNIKSKLEAFQFGAQDYIVKPFEPLELLARVKAKLIQPLHSPKTFQKGDLIFDGNSNALKIKTHNELTYIPLTPTEFKLLFYLAQREGRVFSRNELLDYVWSNNCEVVERVIDQHISKIRTKIKQSDYTIRTHFGLGYSFEPLQKE